MNIYRLKISLAEPHYPINEMHRIVEVAGNMSFHELHGEILKLFEHDNNPHWDFFISRQKMDNLSKLLNCREYISPDNHLVNDEEFLSQNTIYPTDTHLDKLNLAEKEYIYHRLPPIFNTQNHHYLHRIRIEKVYPSDEIFHEVNLIKSVGQLPSPPTDNHANINDKSNNANDTDLDLEVGILSAMMLIATADVNPVRYDELIKNNIADVMIQRNLIKPYLNPAHRVKLTPFGESELVRMMALLGI